MRQMRNKWGSRVVVAWVLASLVHPLFLVKISPPQSHVFSSYADWLRLQISAPSSDLVDQALDKAISTKAQSLEAFLKSFIQAYEALHPNTPLAEELFNLRISEEALLVYLQSRYLHVIDDAVLPRPSVVTAVTQPAQLFSRFSKAITEHDGLCNAAASLTASISDAGQLRIPVVFRLLSAARPLGP